MVTLGEIAGFNRPRPAHLSLTSVAALYAHFEVEFLGGYGRRSNTVSTGNSHTIKVQDHHFFHLVKMSHSERGTKLNIKDELPHIRALTTGFGDYVVMEERARALPTLRDTLHDPDEVIEGLKVSEDKTATHCFWKWYGGGPSPFTIVLVKVHKAAFIPITSFAVSGQKLRKYQEGGKTMWRRLV